MATAPPRQNTIQVMLMRRALAMEWWESAAMKRASMWGWPK